MLDVLDILDGTKYPEYPKHYVLDVLDVLDGTKYPKHYPWLHILAIYIVKVILSIRS